MEMQDKKVIKMSDYPSMASARDMLKPSVAGSAKPLPAIETDPHLYHVCELCGVIEPQWIALLNRWIKKSCPCVQKAREAKEREERSQAWLNWQRSCCYGGWLGPEFTDAHIAAQLCSKSFDSFDALSSEKAYQEAKN